MIDTRRLPVPNMTHGVHGPEARMHLIANQSYEETEVWCGAEDYRHGETTNPREAGCLECLDAAAKYGLAAESRRVHLLFRYTPEAAPHEDKEELGE